ncbi:hypothetical protein [Glycomyces tarimensis]
MGIELELHSKRPTSWEKSRESLVRGSYRHGNDLAVVLARDPHRERGRLGSVDPYGNTVFNDQDAGAALSEIPDLLKRCINEQETAAVRDLAEIMASCVQGTYLWFIGD